MTIRELIEELEERAHDLGDDTPVYIDIAYQIVSVGTTRFEDNKLIIEEGLE